MKKIYILLMIVLLSLCRTYAQVSVVNIQLTAYNVTPETMLAAAISNTGDAQQVMIVSRLYNTNGELLLTIKSGSFTVKQGLNAPFDGNRKVSDVQYSMGKQAEYVKTTHSLPSGTFRICIDLIKSTTAEITDQFCDELESDFNQYLYLVFPADKDTVESTTPLLIWTHNEPFSLLAQGESYRMIVSEMKDQQKPEEAITVNSPLMAKNFLTTHNLQYPYDAPALVEGGHYAWQVQKVSNGVITNKTEAWEFFVHKTPEETAIKYVSLKKTQDAAYYTAVKNKIYFTFDEEYASGTIKCEILNSKRELILPKAHNESFKSAPLDFKTKGYNRYEIDLNELEIKQGYYTLQVRNEKNELFLLTFYVQ
ncbi:MAG: hypothetical protein JWP12_1540 [Bacteroidetes bacterium]|nr:hypothetical protein [Bacteroidota bacterium]